MRKRLTQLKVDKLRPDPARRLEVPDHLYPALRLIVQPSGARSFAVRTRIAGKPAKVTLPPGLDLAGARAAARDLLAEVAKGEDPRAGRKRVRADTLADVAERYLKVKAGVVRRKTLVERVRHLHRDWAPLHDRTIASIDRREVNAQLAEIASRCGPIAANRSRASLHALFQWAVVEEELLETNVVAVTRRPLKDEPTRDRVLTPAERRALWAATAGGIGYDAIVRLLLLLGQRRAEVGAMTWDEVDLSKALWSLPPARVKNARAHLVPLPRKALELIDAQPRRGDFVFGAAPFADWTHSKRRLDKRLPQDMPRWVLHDCRRTLVTGMNEELGVAPHVVEAIVNHVSGDARRGVAGTYNRALYLQERARALQAWADHLTGEAAVVTFPMAS